jgi:hypothetical protein
MVSSTRSVTGSETAARLGRQAGHRIGADGRVRGQPHGHPRGAVEAPGSLDGQDATGIGTFVTHGGTDSAVFRIRADQLRTLHDVVAMLELRIGDRDEAASLAAQRRSDDNLAAMRQSLMAFTQAVEAGKGRSGP